MFEFPQNQNSADGSEEGKPSSGIGPSDQNKLIENTIHTMKKDMSGEIASSSPNVNQQPAPPSAAPNPWRVSPNDASEKQRTSPFLSQEKKVAPVQSPTPVKEAATTSQRGKIITIAIFVLIVLIAAAGGYYFWITRKSPAPPPVVQNNNPEPEPIAQPEPEPVIPTPPPAISISLENPNPINVDIETLDSSKLKEILSKYNQRIQEMNTAKPAEFIINDLQNNPVDFKIFAKKVGINLSPATVNSLGTQFSLYILNDNATPKLGLEVDSKNDIQLKSALTKEEPDLIKELAPLLFTNTYSVQNNKFSSSSYGGAAIRYQNIISPEELSMDYTVFKNKFLIGTTKTTLRSIIDHISASSAISSKAASPTTAGSGAATNSSIQPAAGANSSLKTAVPVSPSTTNTTPAPSGGSQGATSSFK